MSIVGARSAEQYGIIKGQKLRNRNKAAGFAAICEVLPAAGHANCKLNDSGGQRGTGIPTDEGKLLIED